MTSSRVGANRLALSILLSLALGACGPTGPGNNPDSGGHNQNPDASVRLDGQENGDAFVFSDASPRDSGNIYYQDSAVLPDGCVPTPCANPVPQGCQQPPEICGNGLDDDCNGLPDDTCTCVPGQVQPCFIGPPNHANVGACQMGTQTCRGNQEFGFWGPCENGSWPSAEVCDALDNDCNGCIDDGLCCNPDITCPDPTQIPDAQPFVPYVINGTQWYPGPASSWTWTVEGGPCDTLLGDSFTITNGNTGTPTINFTLSGDYAVTMTVQTPDGPKSCSFVIHVVGPGLRVELCWQGTGSRDIDLHMLRQDFSSTWCDTTYDCYYMNCKASSPWAMGAWGYSDGPLSLCEGGPEGTAPSPIMCLAGGYWSCRGSCANPRLDIDNIMTVGIPENINVDAPGNGQVFRIMAHYYSGSGEPSPLVNVYCDGHRVATYGQAPDLVTGFTASGHACAGSTWRVADVTTQVSGGVTTCTVDAVHPPGQSTGYYVRQDSTDYN
ncbi:MAG: MopE-related protein [Polyangia bacterium]|jgi:hypothetical protein|nr:MopE-related protein [Polyangia bacterium]